MSAQASGSGSAKLQIISTIVQLASGILSGILTGGAATTLTEAEAGWQLLQSVLAYHATVQGLPYDPSLLKPFVPITPPSPVPVEGRPQGAQFP